MDSFQHVAYSKEVVEFVAVTKEFCDFIETASSMERNDVLQRLQKFIPLIYLKGSLLPSCECEEGLTEDTVSEDDYNALYTGIHTLMAEVDEYLEVFDESLQYSEQPVVHSISEKICDVYQDLKNFLTEYRTGMPEIMSEALWQLNNNFELYWGKTCAELLRAVHHAVYQVADNN